MSKKKKWIIIAASILVVVAMGVGVGLGVGLSNRIKYKAHIFEGSFDWRYTDTHEDIFELATSLEKLKEICDKYNNPAYSEDDLGYSGPINTKIREYDDAYFSEKAIIIFTILNAHSGIYNKVKKVYVDNNVLVVNFAQKQRRGLGFAQVITYSTILIEIKKADISEITDIKYIINNEY